MGEQGSRRRALQIVVEDTDRSHHRDRRDHKSGLIEDRCRQRCEVRQQRVAAPADAVVPDRCDHVFHFGLGCRRVVDPGVP